MIAFQMRNCLITGAVTLGLFNVLMLPAWLAQRQRRPQIHEGIETIDDALSVCRRSGLSSWDLVTYAQQLVYRKFSFYSCRNLWDTPAQAFRYGMGYCSQYNMALLALLVRLGFETRPVFSLKVEVKDNPAWTMGHTWLRIQVRGDERDVCAGHNTNTPGQVNFVPVWPVWSGNVPLLLFTHLGMILFCGFLEWRALITGSALPDWMFEARESGRV